LILSAADADPLSVTLTAKVAARINLQELGIAFLPYCISLSPRALTNGIQC
jgi:hypothetical protein